MNRTTKILLTVGVLVIVAYPGVAWLSGLMVEHQIERGERQLSHEAPYLAIVKQDYQRGVYRSRDIVTYEIHKPMAPGQAAAVPTSFTVTVRNIIRHGPFPGLRTFALATIDSTLVLPDNVRQQISKVLGSKPVVLVHTRIGWFGATASTITVPAFKWKAADGSRIAWQGLSGSMHSHGNLTSWSGHITVPELSLRMSDGGRLKLLGVAFSGRGKKVFDTLFAGHSRFGINQLDGINPRTGTAYMLRHMALRTATDVHGAFVDSGFNVSADEAQFAKTSLSHIVYAAKFEHLHGPTLAQLSRALRTAERDASGDPARFKAQALAALRQYGAELLLHDPVLQIPKVTFTMPEGTFLFSANVSAPGLSASDLGWPTLISALKTHGHVIASLRIDNALLKKLIGLRGSGSRAAAQIAALEREGYLSAGATAVSTQLRYAGGRLTLDGKPFPRSVAAVK